MYAQIANNEVIKYPAFPDVENTNVSFPVNWNGGEINEKTYVVIEYTTPLSSKVGWQTVENTPVYENGVWKQSWSYLLKTKEEIKTDVSQKRYEVETGGVYVSNNIFSTDRESQTKYVAVAVDISQSNAQTWSINWKTATGNFVTLDASQMMKVINGVRSHVQSCFDKESEFYFLIDSANNSVLETTNFNIGWPSNS